MHPQDLRDPMPTPCIFSHRILNNFCFEKRRGLPASSGHKNRDRLFERSNLKTWNAFLETILKTANYSIAIGRANVPSPEFVMPLLILLNPIHPREWKYLEYPSPDSFSDNLSSIRRDWILPSSTAGRFWRGQLALRDHWAIFPMLPSLRRAQSLRFHSVSAESSYVRKPCLRNRYANSPNS